MKLILTFCAINVAGLVVSQSFLYEKMHNYGKGRRIIENYRMFDKHLYPVSLSTTTAPYIRSPYHNIYQGVRRKGDRRVYNNIFDHAENAQGQKVFCRGDFGCLLNHISVETEGGVPILLRGGVGYRHFTVLVRAAAGVRLKGRVRAYCYNYTEFDDDLF